MSVASLNDDGLVVNQPGGRVRILTHAAIGDLNRNGADHLLQVLRRPFEEEVPPEDEEDGTTISLRILLRHDMAVAPLLTKIEWEANMMRSVEVAAEIPMQQVGGVST